MDRMPRELKPVQARRERLALAVLAGAEFEWRWLYSRNEVSFVYSVPQSSFRHARKQWFITYLPRQNYLNGPYETKREAVEAALKYLETPHERF